MGLNFQLQMTGIKCKEEEYEYLQIVNTNVGFAVDAQFLLFCISKEDGVLEKNKTKYQPFDINRACLEIQSHFRYNKIKVHVTLPNEVREQATKATVLNI